MPRDAAAGGRRVWGLSVGERLSRNLVRSGISPAESVSAGEPLSESSGRCVLLRDDLFYDERIIPRLLESENVVIRHPLSAQEAAGSETETSAVAAICDAAHAAETARLLFGERAKAPEGVRSLALRELVPDYNARLRKRDPAFVLPESGSEEELRELEDQLFKAAYKGITDLVTKWVFPRPAQVVTHFLAERGVRPNTVTAWSWVLAIGVIWLFSQGWLATGLATAFLMSFLDTVDGKLARCTLTSTPFGNLFDHGLDQIHPPLWWGAWAMALPGGIAGNQLAFGVVLGGYLAGRLLEVAFTRSFGMQFFLWRPFDSAFRHVIARRNPNLLLLTAGWMLGEPTWGFNAVAVWTVTCVCITAGRNVQAHLAARRGTPIRSWLDQPERPDEILDAQTG